MLETVPGDVGLFSLAHPQLFHTNTCNQGISEVFHRLTVKLSPLACFWVTIKHKWSGWLLYSKIWINNLYLFLLTSLNLFPQSKRRRYLCCAGNLSPSSPDRWAFRMCFLWNPLVSPIKMSSGGSSRDYRRVIGTCIEFGKISLTFCQCHSGVWVRTSDLSNNLKRGRKSWI